MVMHPGDAVPFVRHSNFEDKVPAICIKTVTVTLTFKQ